MSRLQSLIPDRLSTIQGRRMMERLGFPLFSDLYVGPDFRTSACSWRQWRRAFRRFRQACPWSNMLDVAVVQVQIQGKPVEVMIGHGLKPRIAATGRTCVLAPMESGAAGGSMVAVVGEVARTDRASGWKPPPRGHSGSRVGPRSSPPARPALGPSLTGRFLRHLPRIPRTWLWSAARTPRRSCHRRAQHRPQPLSRPGWPAHRRGHSGSPARKANLGSGTLVTQSEHGRRRVGRATRWNNGSTRGPTLRWSSPARLANAP